MEGVSFWEWVAMYGLDGIGGGVLGGAVAAWLLRQTIKHERKQQREASDDGRVSELLASLRVVHSSFRALKAADVYAIDAMRGPAENLRAELLFAEIASRAVGQRHLTATLMEFRERIEEMEFVSRGRTAKDLAAIRTEGMEMIVDRVTELLSIPGEVVQREGW